MNSDMLNAERAEENRQFLRQSHMAAISLVGPVGCGKTTLIGATLWRLPRRIRVALPLDSTSAAHDPNPIASTDARFVQAHTDRLNASWLGRVLRGGQFNHADLMLIEQTATGARGCTELGQNACVAVLSVAAGDEAVGRCPALIESAKLVIVTKSDLLPTVRFDRRAFRAEVRRLNPLVQILELSSSNGLGLDSWINWLDREVEACQIVPVDNLVTPQDTAAHILSPDS
jgi:hydrogenase nickel incorporation protein HypB